MLIRDVGVIASYWLSVWMDLLEKWKWEQMGIGCRGNEVIN